MSNKKIIVILMALVAMSCFSPSISLAQATKPKATPQKIQTPNTSKELMNDKPAAKAEPEEDENDEKSDDSSSNATASSTRKLRQHGLGLGIGETFLLGSFGKYGEDKITADILYSYAASYSFDLLVDAHLSNHKDSNDRMKLMGLSTSIKGRVVEYDNFSPYLLGGLGFYAPRLKTQANGWSDQKLAFGLNFGGGIDLRLNDEFVVGVMTQLHKPFTVKQDDGPDVKGYYAKLLITGMYLFQ